MHSGPELASLLDRRRRARTSTRRSIASQTRRTEGYRELRLALLSRAQIVRTIRSTSRTEHLREPLRGARHDASHGHRTSPTGQRVTSPRTTGVGPGSSALSGLAFEFDTGSAIPGGRTTGALFFADNTRKCIWVMMPGATGEPDPANIQPFVTPASAGPVNLEISPAGELFYPGYDNGEIRRITYSSAIPDCTTGQYEAEYFNEITPEPPRSSPVVRTRSTTTGNPAAPAMASTMTGGRLDGLALINSRPERTSSPQPPMTQSGCTSTTRC